MLKENNSESTVRARTVKMLIFVTLTAGLIIGGGVYILFDAKAPLTQAIANYNQNRDLLAQLRIDIQRLDDQYSIIGYSRADKQQLPEEVSLATERIEKVFSQLHSVRSFRSQTGILPTIETAQVQLREIESKRKTEATSFLRGTLDKVEFQTGLRVSLEKEALAVGRVKAAILSFSEQELMARFQKIIFWIIPLTLALFILPLAVVMAVLRRINRDLLGYVWSLYNLSVKNEDSSTRLRVASQNLATTSSQQSAAITQTSSSITQIRSMLLETEKRVREVQDLTTEMDRDARKGQEVMQKLEQSMRSIEETNRQIENFSNILNQIQTKTQVINDIVFKTQLLSFNASIEAARAGQNGRGFSVVAEEVGKLAMLSGDAARDIDQLLNQSSTRVSQIVSAVNERAQAGTSVSQDVLVRFSGLAKKLDLVSQKVTQVAMATAEQTGGIEQTENAMEQVSLGANENKAQAEEVRQVSDIAFQQSQKIREVSIGIRRFVREDRRSKKRPDDTLSEVKVLSQEQEGQSVADENLKVLSFVSKESASEDIDLTGFDRTPMNRLPRDLSADHPTFRKVEGK